MGGFGESPYLQKRLAGLFDRHGVTAVTAEEPTFVDLLVNLMKCSNNNWFIAKRPQRERLFIVPLTRSFSRIRREGAMLWFVKQNVTARVAKATIGASRGTRYLSDSVDHLQRFGLRYQSRE